MKKIITIAFLILPTLAIAWDGTDSDTGESVEIDRGNLVRRGKDIEFYDSKSAEYRTAEVQSVRRFGKTVEVEVYDYDAGEFRTFEMDD